MKGSSKPKLILALITLVTIAAVAAIPLARNSLAATPSSLVALPDSVPAQVASATLMGPHQAAPGEQFTVDLLMAMNNQSQMHTLMGELYDPQSSLYHHWLQTGEFDARFGPTASQVAAAKSFLTGAGLTLVSDNTSAFLLEAQGSLAKIEAAFHVSIMDYHSSDGSTFFSNSTYVQIPISLSGIIQGVLGLNNISVPPPLSQSSGKSTPNFGGGPGGSGLTPSQLAGIYDAGPVYKKLHDKGQGVTLGLFELYDYTHSDIAVYEKQFGLPHVPITIIPVAGGTTDHSGAAEDELDIEAQMSLAPGVKRILVYEAAPILANFVSEALQIASDNKADVVSVSYGLCEFLMPHAVVLGESVAYAQMALQGQSAFVSTGDSGAFACIHNGLILPFPQALQVGDPASQPFVTAVGGTSFVGTFDPGTNPHPKYPGTAAEHVWNEGCTLTACGAGTGGVSRNWAALSTQVGPGVIEPGFSQSGSYCGQVAGVPCREVPDVSLVAQDFSEYCTDPVGCPPPTEPVPGWFPISGTSLSTPLWSAIAALLENNYHGRAGLFTLNRLYEDDSVHGYQHEFHDITVGNNGYYPAGPFYDLSTGIGSADIYNFVKDLPF
jgi:subtilase family serine protease